MASPPKFAHCAPHPTPPLTVSLTVKYPFFYDFPMGKKVVKNGIFTVSLTLSFKCIESQQLYRGLVYSEYYW